MKVAVFKYPNSRRSSSIAEAMAAGIRYVGDTPSLIDGSSYQEPICDVAVFYGLIKKVMDGYRAAGKKFIYIDLGYWGRHEGGRRHGYHKVSVNSRHPTEYFQKIPKKPDRFRRFNIPILPWRDPPKNGFVMLAGMSDKAARAEGFRAEEWERAAAAEIRAHTKRSIVYRPKPNWPDFKPIEGTALLTGTDAPGDVCSFLKNCHAVVTHHSNVAIDALLYGVPVFVQRGVTSPLASRDLALIENPPSRWLYGREQWAHDLAWTQWSVAEIAEGLAWRYLKEDGLVP